MKKFTIAMAALAVAFTAFAAPVSLQKMNQPAPRKGVVTRSAMMAVSQQLAKDNRTVAGALNKARRALADPADLPAPDQIAAPITQQPEGAVTLCAKEGLGYNFNWFLGVYTQDICGGLTNVCVSSDGSKIYIQKPIFFDAEAAENWIVGDLADGVATFSFPQCIAETDFYGDGELIKDYAFVMEYGEDEEGGWYFPCADQKLSFEFKDDGSLVPLFDDELMLGMCAYYSEDEVDEGEEPGYSWLAVGDFIYSIAPITDKPVAVPDDVVFEENWVRISNYATVPVGIGFSGDKVFVRGLFNAEGMENSSVEGTLSADGKSVSFKRGQYFGPYFEGGTTAYFFPFELVGEEGFEEVVMLDELVFVYDAEAKVLSNDKYYAISCSPEKLFYYEFEQNPRFYVPAAEFEVKALPDPVVAYFSEENEDYDEDAYCDFYFPTYDADFNPLDTSKLFYQVWIDNELYTFYSDEYWMPEGVESMTDIPFGFNTEDTDVYEFMADGNMMEFNIHARGAECIAFRTLYKDGDKVIYSPMVSVLGEFSKVNGINADRRAESVRFFDLNGVRVANPTNGLYIKQTVYSDGTVSHVKNVVAK